MLKGKAKVNRILFIHPICIGCDVCIFSPGTGDDETITQYLVRAKVLLECMHYTANLADIAGSSRDNLYLMHGLKAPHSRKRVIMEQESWRTMEDVFHTIHHIIKIKENSEPNFEPMPWMSIVSMNEVSLGKYAKPKPTVKTYNSNPNSNVQYSSNYREGGKYHSSQFHKDQGKPKYNTCGPRKLECYYAKGSTLSGIVRN